VAAPIASARKLTRETYHARGATALRDAFAAEIGRLDGAVRRHDRALVVVITDGYENASREVTHAQLRRAVERHERLPNWTFQYIGADQDAFAVGQDLGMTANMVSAEGSSAGVAATYRAMSASTAAFVAACDLAPRHLTQADYDAELRSRAGRA
jgi:hypothetical protein